MNTSTPLCCGSFVTSIRQNFGRPVWRIASIAMLGASVPVQREDLSLSGLHGHAEKAMTIQNSAKTQVPFILAKMARYNREEQSKRDQTCSPNQVLRQVDRDDGALDGQ